VAIARETTPVRFWFGHITTIHAIASIIVFIGVSVALGGIYGRGPRAPV
jgi:hypothetical protein